ncbi:MAG: deoxyribonuclease IV [Lachnospiraceae bacterium]
MLTIGCHLSSSKGYLAMGKQASELGANTFAFFTRNPRGGAIKPLDPADMEALRGYLAEHHFGRLVAHAPYTCNLCSDKERAREFAYRDIREDLERMEYLPGNYYNFHPGSHMKQGAETAAAIIADALNHLLYEGMHTTVLLETMAGKGTEVGRSFEELKAILDRVDKPEYLGVCLDTCHVSDAGYDIISDLDGVLKTFDEVIGLPRLKAVHINDSKNPPGSHKDRHEKIGQGYLGLETFRAIVNHPYLKTLPMILETPQEKTEDYREEIALIRSLEDTSAGAKPSAAADVKERCTDSAAADAEKRCTDSAVAEAAGSGTDSASEFSAVSAAYPEDSQTGNIAGSPAKSSEAKVGKNIPPLKAVDHERA